MAGHGVGCLKLLILLLVIANGCSHSASPLAMGVFFRSMPITGSTLRGAGRNVLRAVNAGETRAAAKAWGKKAASTTATIAQEAGSRTVTLARTFPEAYMRLMQTRPVAVCGCLEAVRHLVGDIISQRFESYALVGTSQSKVPSSNGLQLERLSVLTAWGAWYGGTIGYQSYHNWYPAWFGIVGTRAALKTTAMDLLVTCPFLYYPIWHIFKGVADSMIARNGPKLLSSMSAAEKMQATCQHGCEVGGVAWNNYKNNFVGDTAAMAVVWLPLHMLNFRFIPFIHRFPFIATAGIIWTTVFSYLQYGTGRGHAT